MAPASESSAASRIGAVAETARDVGERRVSLRAAWAIWIGASVVAWGGVLLLARLLFI